MRNFIEQFTDQLREAVEIAESATLKKSTVEIKNVVITGLGGSGIGGTILQDWTKGECRVPIVTNKDYDLPAFVDRHTLVIASSYSGNTEETLHSTEQALQKGAQAAAVTSGGKLLKRAEENDFNVITVPGGNPPRAMLAYSLVQLLKLFGHYDLYKVDFKKVIADAISLIEKEEQQIKKTAKVCAKSLHNTVPYIYAVEGYGGLAVRTRQQINENAKMLCNAHVIPEMNHNELVGWAGGNKNNSALIFRSSDENPRNDKRVEINEKIIRRYTDNVHQVWSKGDHRITRTLYHIHLGDWISLYLSELNGCDPVEVKVIDYLKSELAAS